MSLPTNFAAKVVESTCRVWVGATNSRGYGVVWIDGQPELAHRVAYEEVNGPVPEGMTLDHLCRVRNCVRVDHLEPVTIAENSRRGRAASGLRVGDQCINGHRIESPADLYVKPTGRTECQHCRRSSARRVGGVRPSRQTAQRRAPQVAQAIREVAS